MHVLEGTTKLRLPDPRRKNIVELSPDSSLQIRAEDFSIKGRFDAATGRG